MSGGRLEDAGISLVAGPGYRRRVLGLLAGLGAIVLLYLGLVAGCLGVPALAIMEALERPWLWPVATLALLVFGPAAAFLLRGLGHRPVLGALSQELAGDAEPRLRAFVVELAARLGAPAPARIRLSPGVNAAMLSGVGGRELVLGLGLVNVLGRRELAAVLAHELGHFAQSSTRVGQWAHRVVLILAEVVRGRTRLDARLGRMLRDSGPLRGVLAGLVLVELRGLRAVLRPPLEGIVRLNLALARELEFNADLHAVALCGSDALVSALWRTQRGALAMNQALARLAELGRHGVFSEDLYVHQLARIDELDELLEQRAEPGLAALRRPYVAGPALHFPVGELRAEQGFYTHPSSHERERNAKQHYVPPLPPPGGEDEPGACDTWSLFEDPASLRRSLSRLAYTQLVEPAPAPERLLAADEVERRLAEELAERTQAEHHFGFYANRIIELGPVDAIVAELERAPPSEAELEQAVGPWRGPALAAFMERWRATELRLTQIGEAQRRQAQPELEAELARLLDEREDQLEQTRAADRAIFAWTWVHADPRTRAELVARYHFLDFVQRGIRGLNRHHARLGEVLGPRGQATDEVELGGVLDVLHRDLSELLREAETVELPELANLDVGLGQAGAEPGATLRVRLLDAERLPPRPLDPEASLGDWMKALMAQVGEVHGRLRTFHYKNLGRLLAIHDRFTPEAGETAR